MPHKGILTRILDRQLTRFNTIFICLMQPGLSCLLLHISCLFKAVSPLSFPVDEDQAPFYSSWKSERAREQEIKRNAKDIDKRRSERERKRWEMETGERGEQSACEREQEWERRCEGDVCKCVRVEERGARESDIQKRGEAQEKNERASSRAPSHVLITHVRPIITLQEHLLTGKMKAEDWSGSPAPDSHTD